MFLSFSLLPLFLECVCVGGVWLYIYKNKIYFIYGLSRSILRCAMKNRDIYWERYKRQETLYVGQYLSPLQISTLGLHPVLPTSLPLFKTLQNSVLKFPSAVLWYFPESHWWSEISSFSKLILVLGKARRHRVPNLGSRGSESPRWFDILPKSSAWDVMHELACCCDGAANHQLPIAAAFWITQSFLGEMFKLKA